MKYYKFKPLKDITAYELACICKLWFLGRYSNTGDFLEELPEICERHIEVKSEEHIRLRKSLWKYVTNYLKKKS